MKVIKKINYLIVAFLFLASSAIAQVDYISAQDYMAKLKTDNNMVTLHAGKAEAYQKTHIKGSILFSYSETNKPGDVKGLMKNADELANMLGHAGISQNNTIVVYDGGTQKYASRMYWLIKYLGEDNVLILHKDLNTWRQARIPLTSVPLKLKPTTFVEKVNPNILATQDFVKKAINNPRIVLVDARDTEEYNGTDGKSAGHIKSAIHLNYKDFLAENGAFKTKEQIKTIVKKAGVTQDEEVILYCHTSVRGAVSFYVFKNILDYPKVRLYDGAMEEWTAAGNPLSK